MFPIKRGDIVFNHEQSRQLLKHGRISGRGKAYADGNVGYLAGNALIAHDTQMQEMINHLNTNNIVTNNMPSITIGDINITCPGITSRDVARQVGAEINHLFSGLHLDALQLSMMR